MANRLCRNGQEAAWGGLNGADALDRRYMGLACSQHLLQVEKSQFTLKAKLAFIDQEVEETCYEVAEIFSWRKAVLLKQEQG